MSGCDDIQGLFFFFHTGFSSMQVFYPSNTPWFLLKDDRSISKKVRVVSFFQTADSACHLCKEKAGEFLIFLSMFNP